MKKMHIMGVVSSRTPRTPPRLWNTVCNSAQPVHVELPEEYLENYKRGQMFGMIYEAIQGSVPNDDTWRSRIYNLLYLFKHNVNGLCYKDKLCVPRAIVHDALNVLHGNRYLKHFSCTETISIPVPFYLRNKTKVVEAYCLGCMVCRRC